MADITLLRQNAIVRNASLGATPPHGPLKTGELPLVHVKQPPGGPQIQEGQQRPVTILPPKDADSAVRTGGLPMVKVKMTDGKAKLEDGIDEKVVIRDLRHGAVSTGGLPMIQVKMDGGKPQVQTVPNVAGAGPQIPAAPPVLSAPRVAREAPVNQGYVATPTALATVPNHGYVARAAVPATSQVRVARVAAPQVALPPVPEFTTDQLMLCRHLADTYLKGLLVETPSEMPADASTETVEVPVISEAVQLAKATLATIDNVLVFTAVRAEAAAISAQAQAMGVQPVPAIPTVAASASASIAPTPAVAYTAGRVGAARSYSMAGARSQRNSGMAPRRTPRPAAGPLPMVQVKMDGQRAVVQNQVEISEAKTALEAEPVSEPIATPQPDAPSTDVVSQG
jgi:hypothetical protein